MIRILHTADLHLGVETYGRPFVPEDDDDPYAHLAGLSTRLVDTLRAFDEAVDFALNNDVDLFLFCGDAFHRRNPSPTLQREFACRVARLASNGIQVFLLIANHDLPNSPFASALEIFDTLAVPNVTVAGQGNTHRIETRNGPLQLVALPWPRPSIFLSKDEYKNVSIDDIDRILRDKLTNFLDSQVLDLDNSIPAILSAHVRVPEARLGAESLMILGTDHVMFLSDLANPAFDYVALGHMHCHQEFDRLVRVAYPGSLIHLDFREEDEDKGFIVLQVDPGKERGSRLVSSEFHPVKSRRFLSISVNADNDQPTETVLAVIKKKPVRDAIVRVQIKISERYEGLLRDDEIRQALKDAYYVAAISHDVEREHRSRLAVSAEQMSPLEALKAYMETRKTPQDRQQELLQHAEWLIHGVDILEGG